MAIPGQVQLVLADVLEGELIGGPHEVADEVADAAHIALAGVRAVPPDAELLVHAIAELAHDVLLSGMGETLANRRTPWSLRSND